MARPNRRTRARLAAARLRARSHRAAGWHAPAAPVPPAGPDERTIHLSLPIPPGATPAQIAAGLAAVRAEVEALGGTVHDVHLAR